jgi:hypothetical protein
MEKQYNFNSSSMAASERLQTNLMNYIIFGQCKVFKIFFIELLLEGGCLQLGIVIGKCYCDQGSAIHPGHRSQPRELAWIGIRVRGISTVLDGQFIDPCTCCIL